MRKGWGWPLGVLVAGVVTGLLLAAITDRSAADLLRMADDVENTTFGQPPVFVGWWSPAPEDTSLRPFAVAAREGGALVSYLATDRIDVFSDRWERTRIIRALKGERASITGLSAGPHRLYAVDFASGALLVLDDSSGTLVQSYQRLPDNTTAFRALSTTYDRDMIYVADVSAGRVLVISASTLPGVREEGELIHAFPSKQKAHVPLAYPSHTLVTPDGRLIVCDAGSGRVQAFTCSGRFAHDFDASPQARLRAPMSSAQDDMPSPALDAIADSLFEPSGVLSQGRFHVVDAVLARINVYDPLGKYVLTYGAELAQPNGIMIDRSRRLIVVSDAARKALAFYRY